MDLIDASNLPIFATMDPITGNTVSANGESNITDNIQMEDGEALNNEADGEAENYIIDDTPTFHEFSALPSETEAKIVRLLKSIGPFWGSSAGCTVSNPVSPRPGYPLLESVPHRGAKPSCGLHTQRPHPRRGLLYG
jgi:hypothetical protein